MTPADAINLLLSRKWTEARIAAAVGTSQPTINRIKQGAATRYVIGAELIRLATSDSLRKRAA